ncbi:MAG TPA: Xaa-Pro dipeptidase [Thermoanaerobaculia bacterium]|jgi:Xaa-Pro dipeptidase|nr:Xaa-Pro dipeptidase [Thermoanaerobaculia bacterium]
MDARLDKLSTIYLAHITVLKLRHDRALATSGFDHVVIFAGAQHVALFDDYLYPFKVNPHFKWWVPVVDNPHCVLIYSPGLKPHLVYYQPIDYWYKPAETPRGWWTKPFEIEIIKTPEEARQHIPTSGRVAFIGEWDDAFKAWGKLESNPPDLLNRLHFDRAWKTEYEIECIRAANELGARGHIAAEKAFRAGESEYEIHLAYLRATTHAEEELPYANIIALNENAAVLHYVQHIRERLDGKRRYSFLIDAGASYNGYAADITRTYSEKKDEFFDLIQAMDEMQQSICEAVEPKVNYPDLHFMAHRKVAEILRRFEFVKDLDADGIVQKRISSTFLPHGVGHYLGLQVHDVGGFQKDPEGNTIAKPEGHPYLRLTRVVEPSHVFTIEPGLYFIDSLLADLKKSDNAKYVNWPKVDAFRKYGGIRIEDDVAVTDNGHANLTREAFAILA